MDFSTIIYSLASITRTCVEQWIVTQVIHFSYSGFVNLTWLIKQKSQEDEKTLIIGKKTTCYSLLYSGSAGTTETGYTPITALTAREDIDEETECDSDD